MKIIQKHVYRFSELPEETQEKILDDWRNNDIFPFEQEHKGTLEDFENRFPIHVKHWEVDLYGRSHISAEFTDAAEIENLSGIRLVKYLYNNHFLDLYERKYLTNLKNHEYREVAHPMLKTIKLSNGKYFHVVQSRIQYDQAMPTGVYTDYNIRKPLYDFLKKPRDITFYDLLNDCLQEWLYTFQKDIEYYYSDENIKDTIESNNYWFNESGEIEQ